ncbi:MAG: hypothetical protein AB1656_18600 [Candidatus Omnitrophota bacterium]
MQKFFLFLIIAAICLCASNFGYSQNDGFLHKNGRILFPIGCYENPKDVEQLKLMAESGINIVHCHSREDLDRAASAGMLGVVPLSLQSGAADDLKNYVKSLMDHPALAVWEGPDEIVWNFTAASMLYRQQKVHKEPGEWWRQTDNAVVYSRQQAAQIIPKMREAAQMIREMDSGKHPIWINEAARSDLAYVRQYLDFVDITGCDFYPVRKEERLIYRLGLVTDHWMQVGEGKPVWMVLQGFAWSELGEYYGVKETAYPTFDESRFMAYDVIAHGAKGVLYWGTSYLKSELFRQSLYALTSELAALQPFLTSPEKMDVKINIFDFVMDNNPIARGVKSFFRRYDGDSLLVLINEDNRFQMEVEAAGLEILEGQTLELLYGNDQAVIKHGALLTRMKPYEVKVFASSRKWETANRTGRDFFGIDVIRATIKSIQ